MRRSVVDPTSSFSHRVCRLVLYGGLVCLRQVHGDVRPPTADELPAFRYLAYGTSITQGAAASMRHLGYASQTAWRLGADLINLIPVDGHSGEHLLLRRSHIQAFNAQVAPQIAEAGLALGLIQHEDQAYPFGRTLPAVKRARQGEYAQGWYDRHPCFAPWTHSLVDFDGRVYACCMTRGRSESLGDLGQASFTEVWSGPEYRQIRERMLPPDLPACRRCDDFLEENRKLLELLTPGSASPVG